MTKTEATPSDTTWVIPTKSLGRFCQTSNAVHNRKVESKVEGTLSYTTFAIPTNFLGRFCQYRNTEHS